MIKFTLLFLISSTFYQYTIQDTVNITMYYESLCPFCEVFIREQLYPVYQKLGDSLVVDFIPYGGAHRKLVDGKWEFTCQHGPDECVGNRMQGCAFKHYPDIPTQINFLGCITYFDYLSFMDIGKRCAERFNMEWDKITQCVEGSEGDEIMLHNAILTEAVKGLYSVPWLVGNGRHDNGLQFALEEHLFDTVCRMLKVKPKVCSEK